MSVERPAVSQPESKPEALKKPGESPVGQVDVINLLHLKNPARVTMPEVYGMPRDTRPEDVRSMLDGFEIVDPKAFMSAVHSLADRARSKQVPLNRDFLEKVENDEQIGIQERGAAHVLNQNFRGFVNSDREGDGIMRRLTSERKLELSEKGIKNMDATAAEIKNSLEHPEIRNAAELADAAQSIFNRTNQSYLGETQLKTIARSPNYSPRERSAASLLSANYTVIDHLSSPYMGISRDDIQALTRLEDDARSAKQLGKVAADCNQKESAAGNAAAWAAAVTILSIAAGSKHAMRNAIVAAGSAAIAAEVKNSLVCDKTKQP